MRRPLALLVIGSLALAACGGDDDDGGDVSEEEQPYVDAIAGQFTSTEEGELNLTAEQADCVAPRWVDAITVERFEEQGVTPEDITDESEDELTTLGLDEDQGNELIDAFDACDVDLKAVFIESLAADADLSEEDRQCLDDALDDDFIRSVLVGVLTQGEEALEQDEEMMSDLFAAFAECPGAAN